MAPPHLTVQTKLNDVQTEGKPSRLISAEIAEQRGLTPKAPADAMGMSRIQISRSESGASQPTLDVLRRLAVALSVSADELLFD